MYDHLTQNEAQMMIIESGPDLFIAWIDEFNNSEGFAHKLLSTLCDVLRATYLICWEPD